MTKTIVKAWKVNGGWVAIAVKGYKCMGTTDVMTLKKHAVEAAKQSLSERLQAFPLESYLSG